VAASAATKNKSRIFFIFLLPQFLWHALGRLERLRSNDLQ